MKRCSYAVFTLSLVSFLFIHWVSTFKHPQLSKLPFHSTKVKIVDDRTELVRFLPTKARVLELGVRDAKYAFEILQESSKLSRKIHYTGIDSWSSGTHTVNEYALAFKKLKIFEAQSTIIRCTFEEAVNFFEKEYFDFIYIDGFAETGEEKGETFKLWWPYLKSGGLFAGHDYASSKYPLVTKYLDIFKSANAPNQVLYVTKEGDDSNDREKSFYFIKP